MKSNGQFIPGITSKSQARAEALALKKKVEDFIRLSEEYKEAGEDPSLDVSIDSYCVDGGVTKLTIRESDRVVELGLGCPTGSRPSSRTYKYQVLRNGNKNYIEHNIQGTMTTLTVSSNGNLCRMLKWSVEGSSITHFNQP